MTSAPADLLDAQAYLHIQTGQEWASLGIAHFTPQGGGYHEGEDLLIAAGTAPGPQYPGSDYSYTDAPSRDLLPNGRLAGGNYASAFDLGGGFPRFLEFNGWLRARLLAGDPRTADIREFIHTLDGRTVRRIDRTGRQPDGGDDSHLSHSHVSFYRDSVGRRNGDDNFLGLLKEFFGGATKEDDMFSDTDRELLVRLNHGVDALVGDLPALQPGSSWGTKVNELHNRLAELKASSAAEATRDAVLLAAVKALTVATGNDPGPIMAAITAEGEKTRTALLAQASREAKAAQAEADALKS